MTKSKTITMSKNEVKRVEILSMADEKKITQKEGARRTSVSERHFNFASLKI